MTVRFVRLRIVGFKSFADPVTVEILPGLTGIVGPNGCGKSNVVEALRWVMGESSARSLRGGEMDDLIFAGTTGRPARSLAEVTVTLEGTKGFGPAAFADLDELQITRRAERGSGSDYRINGRSVRARDVQTLFADLASGARSSAMVSQGRVAMLVGARPEERRTILEEAAGITGLHARRHEAELKLRATESNLTRAEDRRQQLTDRLDGLAEQSRDASRYRELSAALRDAEAELLAVLHARARLAVERAIDTAARARKALTEHEEAAESAVVAEFEANKVLPGAREKADAARTALERCRVLAEGVAREEERAATQAQDAAERLKQHEADAKAAKTRLDDATATLERLKAEKAETEAAITSLPTRTALAEAKQQALTEELAKTEQTLGQLTADLNTARAAHERAAENLAAAQNHHTRIAAAYTALQAELASLEQQLPVSETIQATEKAVEKAQTTFQNAKTTLDAAERTRSECNVALSVARNNAQAAEQALTELRRTLEQARSRLASLKADLAQAEKRHADTLSALVDESIRLQLKQETDAAAQAVQAAREALEKAETERLNTNTALTDASRAAQEAEAQRRNTENSLRAAESSLKRATQEAQTFTQALEKTQAEAPPEDALKQARAQRTTQEQALQKVVQALETTERNLQHHRQEQTQTQQTLTTLQTELTRLRAQAEGLAEALGNEKEASAEPISAQITVPEEYEVALAVALTDGLDAPAADNAPRGWHLLKDTSTVPLPGKAVALKSVITAPPELNRVLAYTGVVPDGTDGTALQAQLLPGQCLVSRAGDLWRWDGFYTRAGEPDASARRLAQRRILRETSARIAEMEQHVPQAEEKAAIARANVQAGEKLAQEQRIERGKLEQSLQKARTQESELERQHTSFRARLDALRPQQERALAAKAEAEAALASATAAQQALPPLQSFQQALSTARAQHTAAQKAEQDCRTALKLAEQTFQRVQHKQTQTENQHTAATTRLETLAPERQRLKQNLDVEAATVLELEQRLTAAQTENATAAALQDAQNNLEQAQLAFQTATSAFIQAEQAVQTTTQQQQKMQEQALALRSRIAALTPRLEELQHEQQDAQDKLISATQAEAQTAADMPQDAENTLAQLHTQRAALTTQLEATRELRATLLAEATTLEARLTSLVAAEEEWRQRAATAHTEAENAAQRVKTAQSDHSKVSELPAEAQRQKQQTLSALEDAEEAYAQADKIRAEAESALNAANEQRRRTEAELNTARENLLKADAKSEQAQAILDQLLADTPTPPRQPTGDLTESAENALRRKISRLTREREDMGPVNLRAEIEAEEASTQARTLADEISDLEAAISRLRGSIGTLNKEGRERLMAVFTQVDHHFQSLFTRMFGGGRAHLGLVGSDDPLEAGLEIYAQPPGKKLATLSLLSGGEQALTALSLIFAVFRCNPAPVCVLDEVDAPLDDANVGRFSALLGDMVTEAGTRFLVVTHHQLTMAHMDHLFGVTMQERGVSRVLSVDLARAASMAGQNDKEEPNVAP
ncbi:chromosome segregation protein SMC [Acetobacter pomorum]|uniref:Chromosome partition protein Smc n=1 Tax=Acetobacter pomorum TaxID=65959 RepID=A0A2G4RAG3_9PROT|nr:AAA family ATPase [Acetobacter pomorum]PHY93561.1 chromosome segregation protein SMC [Acetobacter pomorum]GBR46322.1 chromosome segregation protein SMC [Acetobacter pomorum DSM 11825]